MERNDGSRRKCFTFIWKLENARYCWHKKGEAISSPTFIVDDTNESKWKLKLVPRSRLRENIVGLYLYRLCDSNAVNVEIDAEIDFLALNGEFSLLGRCRKRTFDRKMFRFLCSARREDVFPERIPSVNFKDTLTIRCKMWKNVGEISNDMHCTAHTRISVLTISFIWNIENFSSLELEKIYTYDIKSPEDNRKLMCLRLCIKRDQKISITISPENQEIKLYTFDLSAINGSGDTIEGLKNEIWCNTPDQIKQQKLHLSKKELMEKKNIYLSNDVLSLKCKCTVSLGTVFEEIERISFDCTAFVNEKMDKGDVVSVSEGVLTESFKSLLNHENEPLLVKSLIHNLKSFVNNGALSDIKLRTSKQTYSANKFILSARSPVFKDMFSGDMSQSANDYVDIEDLDDETFSRILHYIYSSEIEQLQWSSATKLYKGAHTYKISDLKDKCSSYMKTALSRTNACEALELAHLHADEDLKKFVQRFIMKKPRSILNSKEWETLMKKNSELAADTMILKFKNPPKISEEKQEKQLGSQKTPKKRKREEDSKNNSIITQYFSKSEKTQANTVSIDGSSTSQLPKFPTDQKEPEVILIQDLPSSSLQPSKHRKK